MSKLVHSNQETMDELDRLRAIENGDEDLIPAQTAKHTPEKWDFDLGTDGAVISLRDAGTIATISDELNGYKGRARLIAAAPKLLEANHKLIQALEWVLKTHGQNGICRYSNEDFDARQLASCVLLETKADVAEAEVR